MSKQFDVDPQTQRIAVEKLQRKIQLRNEFLKQATDPFQHSMGEGGTVFDPAIVRFQALRASSYEYFRPNGRSIIQGLVFILGPMALMGYVVFQSRQKNEAALRRGEVAYADRTFRFA